MSGAAHSDDRIDLGAEVTGEEQDLISLVLLQAFSIGFGFIALVVVVLVAGSILYSAVKVVKEYERGVIFRLGRAQGGPRGPGLFLLFPFVDRMVKIELRTITIDVPSRTLASTRPRSASGRLPTG